MRAYVQMPRSAFQLRSCIIRRAVFKAAARELQDLEIGTFMKEKRRKYYARDKNSTMCCSKVFNIFLFLIICTNVQIYVCARTRV